MIISSLLLIFDIVFFNLSPLCTLRSIVSNESIDIFSGAAPSSVKSSDCVTIFPVGGGDTVKYVPLLRMWFSRLIQYKQREFEGGCLCGRVPTNTASYMVFKGKIPDREA